MSYMDKRYYADCPEHGTVTLDPKQSGKWAVWGKNDKAYCAFKIGEEPNNYWGKLDKLCRKEVALRVVLPKWSTLKDRKHGCDGRCLHGKFRCDCVCLGKCHGLGYCICGRNESSINTMKQMNQAESGKQKQEGL